MKTKILKPPSPEVTLALSFLAIIATGTLLLMLPISHMDKAPSFLNALFTATSATCVTGLVVVDTGTYWSHFGQIVILLLIQVGGLGIMTFSAFVVYIIAKKLSLWDQSVLELSFSGSAKNLRQLLWMIILGTVTIEAIGAIVLTFRFAHDFDLPHAAYLGLFHAVSAFCNAGFSLFSNSLIDYRGDAVINITLIVLIILGGLGFWVLYDLKNLRKHRRNVHSTSLHTRVVLGVSATLIVFGFLAVFLLEFNHSMSDFSWQERLFSALFQSVSARTAGFNTVHIEMLSNGSLFVMLLLMFIGASPGSCGGGVKTTTFAIVLAMIKSRVRNQEQVNIGDRGISSHTVSRAIGIMFAAITVIGVTIFLLLVFESSMHPLMPERTLFIDIVFETFSAFGTVGLSTGITPQLSEIAKILIIALMFIGRLGPVTIAVALAGVHSKRIFFAEENVWVG